MGFFFGGYYGWPYYGWPYYGYYPPAGYYGSYVYEPPVYYSVPSSVYWPGVTYAYVNPAPTSGYTESSVAPPAAAPAEGASAPTEVEELMKKR